MATLGGVTLPRLTKINVKRKYIGTQTRAHDGTLLTDHTATKRKWSVSMSHISKSDRDAVMVVADTSATQTLVDIDGSSYSVAVEGKTLNEERIVMAGIAMYTLSFDILEV